MQTLKELCTYLLGENFPGATEDYPFGPGTMTAKVGGKIFAFVCVDALPPSIALKCDPEVGDELRADELRALIQDSYDRVVGSLTRAQRAALAAPTSSAEQ